MGLSLRDQLLQAGLVSEKQVQQVTRQKQQQRRDQGKKKAVAVPDERQLQAQREAEAKRVRDQDANRRLLDKVEQKARRAQVKQLVEQNKLPRIDSHEYYNFVAGAKIKRMPVDAARRAQLISGAVAIVNCDGNYEVVPAAVAERIRQRNPHVVIAPQPSAQATSGTGDATDDPYRNHVVPDDLIW